MALARHGNRLQVTARRRTPRAEEYGLHAAILLASLAITFIAIYG